ncbi:MAG: hypothetical protein P4K83_06480 [Terracidiphilus sp.]|nr:hypothetical protein [Terracidiphilus sp.]
MTAGRAYFGPNRHPVRGSTCQVKTNDADGYARKCGGKRKYIGLLVHDMRRSAAKRLRESGIHEKPIMDISGWKTRSMFDRYTITDPETMRRAMAVVTAPTQPNSPQTAPVSLRSKKRSWWLSNESLYF